MTSLATKPSRLLCTLLAVLALLAAACGGGSDGTAEAGASTGAAGTGGDTGTIKLGSILSQSGQLAAIAQPYVDGVELAVAQINEGGGIVVGDTTYQVELLLEDDRSDAGVATAAATGLLEDEEVKFIIGPGTSVTAPAVAQLVVPQGVIMFTPSTAVATMLTADSVEAQSKTLFLTNPSNEDLAAGMQGAFEEALPDAQRVAILMPDNGIGKSIGPVYQEAVEAAGAEVVAFETFPAGATDVSTALTKIKGQDPDVLITGVSVPEVNAVTKQAVELDAAPALFVYNGSLNTPLADATGSPIDIPFISYGLPGTLETLKTSGEVVAVRPGIEQYASDMERVLGRKPQAYGTPGFYLYDFVHMLAEAIEQAGTVDDTAKIADALAALEHEGAVGSIAFSDTHTAKTLGDVCTVEAGAVECHVVGG